MPIRIAHNGVQCECDTAEEAFALVRLLGTPPTPRDPGPQQPPLRHSRLNGRQSRQGHSQSESDAFFQGLNANGRKIIEALAASYPEPLSTEGIAEALGFSSPQIAPILKHVYSCAERGGFSRESVIESVHLPEDPAYKQRYRLAENMNRLVDSTTTVNGS